jgi:hypothetical protein
VDLKERLARLARLSSRESPVVSVYLDTRWADEQQRDRVRVFLKNHLRDARARGDAALAVDLDWVQAEAEAIIARARFEDAHGVALFACRALGLRETLPVRVPFEDAFVVDESPYLKPLVTAAERAPAAVVVFLDGESARLIPAEPDGSGEEVVLESAVEGQHRRGGWALLAQSRYARHIEAHRDRHFDAVAGAVEHLARQNGFERIVLAGEPRNVAAFRKHLSAEVAGRVAGHVAGSRHEPAAVIRDRAARLLALRAGQDIAEAVDGTLTTAAKSGQAVAGLPATLDAAVRGAVWRLHVLHGFREPGRACLRCGALHRGVLGACPACGGETRTTELGEAIVDRVLATAGEVDIVTAHQGLAEAGGIAAMLRYPLGSARAG